MINFSFVSSGVRNTYFINGVFRPTATAAWIPLAAGCCIALVFGFAAVAIVLSLIPVYLPTKNIPFINQSKL